MSNDCKCITLTKVEGPLHEGRDYVCEECGQQYRIEPLDITVSHGPVPEPLPERPASDHDRHLGTHLSHCNFGENSGQCKYGESDCPALTEGWSWFGNSLQRAALKEVEISDFPYSDIEWKKQVWEKLCQLAVNDEKMRQLDAIKKALAAKDYKLAEYLARERMLEQGKEGA
jgi:hypothetical protein